MPTHGTVEDLFHMSFDMCVHAGVCGQGGELMCEGQLACECGYCLWSQHPPCTAMFDLRPYLTSLHERTQAMAASTVCQVFSVRLLWE